MIQRQLFIVLPLTYPNLTKEIGSILGPSDFLPRAFAEPRARERTGMMGSPIS